MCPPMGFIAPPGAKLNVAPGSAVTYKNKVEEIRREPTLDLVCEQNGNLVCRRRI